MRLLFGPSSWKVLQPVLGVRRSQALRLMQAEHEPSLTHLDRVSAWSRRLPGMLDRWREESLALVEAEYRDRQLEIAAGVTRLKALRERRRKELEAKERERAVRKVRKRERHEAERVIEAPLIRDRVIRDED